MEKKTVVLYPGVGVGHLAPMLELAKAFLRHGAAVDVAVALVEPPPPVQDPGFSAAVAGAKASNTSVAIHVLPSSPPLPASGLGSDDDGEHVDLLVRMFRFLRAMNAPLRDFLRSLPHVQALVLDMFCGDALDVAAELGLPAYFFFATGAAGLAVFLGLPGMRASMDTGFRELGDAVLSFPGAPPFKASELPEGIADDGEACKAMLRMAARMPEARGILINTFESLEPRAVRALRDGLCVPGRPTPPVYCVGPLVSEGGEKEHESLRWLDAQPDRSVVFLSFGSMGTFPKKQLEEIAIGLENSGQRFLWVVRSPRGAGDRSGEPDDNLDALLPAGFLERTKDTGLVVMSWAPQVDVLRHRAAGAFVTHCGWNSTLEGVAAGLPLLCWPLYAEQTMNKVWIVEEMELGVEMKRSHDEDVVKAEAVEAKVRWVMESDGGRVLRERVAAARDRAAEAVAEGGSSHAGFVEFLKDLETSKGMVNVRVHG
ncbi:anthocyanidin 5,3-O-glucosyltransferase-like [Phragmites australis]|uniref:anthocyanidin 5,3-O-glucosyltransferase-like n=1 Tax=Phragmites australis TaxID=29695 RepID=UPI002D79AEAB|nr:anthocyanidin 5,3-O-glucosyltransferase-like [Phragmites australis]